jgi:hypothetical protein
MAEPNDNPELLSSTVSARGKMFVAAWAVAVAILEIFTGYVSIASLSRNKNASNIRHQARVDPDASEPGKTEAERTPPPGLEDRVPDDCQVGVYVDRIVEVSIKETQWTVDFYIWFNWTGGANPGDAFQVVDGQIETKEKLTETEVGSSHYVLYRVTARITKGFDITRYPCDDHLLTINIENTERQSYQLRFIADVSNSSTSSRVKVPGYKIYRTGAVVKPHSYKTTRGDPALPADYRATYSQFIYGIWISRPDYGLYFKLVQGLYVAVATALLALLIKPTDVDPRFGLGVGALFAAIANTYIAASQLPDTGLVSLTDMVNGIGMGTIFLTIVQSTISLYLYDIRGEEALSRLFDKVSLAVILAGYPAINIAIPLVAIV